jgi:hypothetical protein
MGLALSFSKSLRRFMAVLKRLPGDNVRVNHVHVFLLPDSSVDSLQQSDGKIVI